MSSDNLDLLSQTVCYYLQAHAMALTSNLGAAEASQVAEGLRSAMAAYDEAVFNLTGLPSPVVRPRPQTMSAREHKPAKQIFVIEAKYEVDVVDEKATVSLAYERERQTGRKWCTEPSADLEEAVTALFNADGWQPNAYDDKVVEVKGSWTIRSERRKRP